MEVSRQYKHWCSYGVHAELSREPRAEAPIMSAMHAGVMTTSTEMMYAQLVTLTQAPIRDAAREAT